MNRVKIRTYGLVFLGLICISMVASAQTNFNIPTDTPNVEQEYRDELDRWMLRAYEGDRDAQFKVGVLFANDQFDNADYEQAVYWYKQAARQGHALAQYNLGHQYLTGVGVAKNEVTALKWWLEAAQQDHPLAQFNVGRAYYLGIGLEINQDLSRYWFQRAAQNQEPKSIDILNQLGWNQSEPETTAENIAVNQAATTEVETNDSTKDEISQTADDKIDSLDDTNNAIATNTVTVKDNSVEPAAESKSPLSSKIIPVPETGENGENAETVVIINDREEQKVTTEQVDNSSAEPELISKQEESTVSDSTQSSPIALYTDPTIRSVLIAIINGRESVNIENKTEDWTKVKTKTGFPVWVHGDFITANGNDAIVTGDAVNARAVPIITNGTVVGRLNKGEKLSLLSNRKGWYRVVSPTRFAAWAKSDELDKPVVIRPTTQLSKSNAAVGPGRPINANAIPVKPQSEKARPVVVTSTSNTGWETKRNTTENNQYAKIITDQTSGENEWLFAQPQDNYTLQLASFDNPNTISQFLTNNKLIDDENLHRFTSTSNNIKWTYFLYGSYNNKNSAEQSKTKIKQSKAWIRTFGKLQQNRCIAWKTQVPAPKELNKYCVN